MRRLFYIKGVKRKRAEMSCIKIYFRYFTIDHLQLAPKYGWHHATEILSPRHALRRVLAKEQGCHREGEIEGS